MLARAIARTATRNVAKTAVAACVRGMADLASAKHTPLYDVHIKSKGKMVNYCDYALPVQYEAQVTASHRHTRTSASIFDVSHMGQVRLVGDDRVAFIESLCVMDVASAKPNLAKLSVLVNENGGVIDDCMVTPRDDGIYIVLNAGCKNKDMAHINNHIQRWNKEKPSANPLRLDYFEDRALIALQGPKSAEVLGSLLKPGQLDITRFAFMQSIPEIDIAGVKCTLTRCGYTGEDGFEIGCEGSDAPKLWDALAKHEAVLPAGLAARDSLRMEAGLCLYGHELSEDITPVEAGLSWCISPKRKTNGGFLGAEKILDQLKNGASKKLVGLEIKTGAPARQGASVVSTDGSKIGEVTSGGPAPSLDMKKIAIAYINTPQAVIGSSVLVDVRGSKGQAEIVKLPFVQTHYYRVPKTN